MTQPAWTDYGVFAGDALDAASWAPYQMPTANGLVLRVDPLAETTVRAGEVGASIEAFTAASGDHQGMDNTKYLVFSTRSFELTEDRPAHFGVTMAAKNAGGDPTDYRSGFAAFVLTDLDSGTAMVFDIFATSTRVFAEFERLPFPGVEEPFTRVVEDPLVRVGEDFETFHEYRVTLDRGRRRAGYYVDDVLIHEERGIEVFPVSVHMGFGLMTLIPIEGGQSQSNTGQGMSGRWTRFRYAL